MRDSSHPHSNYCIHDEYTIWLLQKLMTTLFVRLVSSLSRSGTTWILQYHKYCDKHTHACFAFSKHFVVTCVKLLRRTFLRGGMSGVWYLTDGQVAPVHLPLRLPLYRSSPLCQHTILTASCRDSYHPLVPGSIKPHKQTDMPIVVHLANLYLLVLVWVSEWKVLRRPVLVICVIWFMPLFSTWV